MSTAYNPVSKALLAAARKLSAEVESLRFGEPITHVYNPLSYAWDAYAAYLCRYATAPKRVVFLGMNPGPFGMVQTGVPFGEVKTVREWLQISARIRKPAQVHPRRPVEGFNCKRAEVSGLRLWGLFASRFGSPSAFFAEHLVVNYCPLAFLEATGKNHTPDKLPASEREALFGACDLHLAQVLALLQPEWLIGIGDFAAQRGEAVANSLPRLKRGKMLHPSPASPAANRGWAAAASLQLQKLGVWPGG